MIDWSLGLPQRGDALPEIVPRRPTAEAPRARLHHPQKHAAARTGEYLFSQLIPYIGNKRKLLQLIGEGLDFVGVGRGWFVDLLTGSTVVARLAKKRGLAVTANDWEPYAYEIARGTVALNRSPAFARLGGPDAVFEKLNSLPPTRGWVARHLCPANDDWPDLQRERLFFTRENGERIDAIRRRLGRWEANGLVTPDERAYVLASLLYAVSYASNTSGVFKAFHRGWGGATSTALHRIRGRLRLVPPVLLDNGCRNLALCEDAYDLAPRLTQVVGARPDVVYIDPPYNQHPYGSNYHVLNSVALGDEPALYPRIQVRGKLREKSAIRKDWRRSAFNVTRSAPEALQRLVSLVDARWLLVSFSTDGNIPLRTWLEILAARGRLHVFSERYKRYRVSAQRMSSRPFTLELLGVVDAGSPGDVSRVPRLLRQLEQEATGL